VMANEREEAFFTTIAVSHLCDTQCRMRRDRRVRSKGRLRSKELRLNSPALKD
jgi:hypothetical protein